MFTCHGEVDVRISSFAPRTTIKIVWEKLSSDMRYGQGRQG